MSVSGERADGSVFLVAAAAAFDSTSNNSDGKSINKEQCDGSGCVHWIKRQLARI